MNLLVQWIAAFKPCIFLHNSFYTLIKPILKSTNRSKNAEYKNVYPTRKHNSLSTIKNKVNSKYSNLKTFTLFRVSRRFNFFQKCLTHWFLIVLFFTNFYYFFLHFPLFIVDNIVLEMSKWVLRQIVNTKTVSGRKNGKATKSHFVFNKKRKLNHS